MQTLNGIRTFKSQADFLKHAKSAQKLAPSIKQSQANEFVKDTLIKNTPSDSVQLTKHKDKSENLGQKLKSKANEYKDAGTSLLKDAGNAVKKVITTPGVFNIPQILGSDRPNDVLSLSDKKIKSDEALVFFVSGLRLNPFDQGEGGLPDMAKYFDSSIDLKWNDNDTILKQIQSDTEKPVILVGHGMGADSIVEIANTLNTPEYGFRKVNLLVTMDSIGFDNDIIPQNVLRNSNFISDQDYFFNDGPNIAVNNANTIVDNQLRPEPHNDLEYSSDVQMKIFENIQDVLFDFRMKKEARVLSQKVGESLPNIAQAHRQFSVR